MILTSAGDDHLPSCMVLGIPHEVAAEQLERSSIGFHWLAGRALRPFAAAVHPLAG